MTLPAIILVEADPSVCEAFQALAQALGFALTVFETVDTAIANASLRGPVVLIADLSADSDIRRLLVWRDTRPTKPVTILLTTLSPALLRRRLDAVRDIKVLRKPVTAAEILDALQAATGTPGGV
ncbi:MAG: hypothetical protein VX529_07090 [Pseudomonadota bacterium]|jgi:FixJ family two-component response regulator|nr:hypothetical protein [Pseudomonadota bacterium]